MQLTVITNTEREVSFDTMDVDFIEYRQEEDNSYLIELSNGMSIIALEYDQDGNTRALLADLYLYHDSNDTYEGIG